MKYIVRLKNIIENQKKAVKEKPLKKCDVFGVFQGLGGGRIGIKVKEGRNSKYMRSQSAAQISVCIQDGIWPFSGDEIVIHLYLALCAQVGAISGQVTADHRAVGGQDDAIPFLR